MPSKQEVYDEVTERIVAALNGGKIPWHKPWTSVGGGMPFNGTTGRRYNGGINNLLLLFSGFSDPRWCGFGQAKDKGWKILPGSKSTEIFIPVFGFGEDKDSGEKYRFVKFFKTGRVFNFSQIEGAPSLDNKEAVDPTIGHENAAMILADSGAHVNHGGNQAYFAPQIDVIGMPEAKDFVSVDAYWSTMMHELVHWTGHKDRLNRGLFGKGFGSEDYAFEELIAEIGSAFVCGHVGIEREEVTKNHEAYVQSWIKKLNDDHSAIFKASALAWNAFNFLVDGGEEGEE